MWRTCRRSCGAPACRRTTWSDPGRSVGGPQDQIDQGAGGRWWGHLTGAVDVPGLDGADGQPVAERVRAPARGGGLACLGGQTGVGDEPAQPAEVGGAELAGTPAAGPVHGRPPPVGLDGDGVTAPGEAAGAPQHDLGCHRAGGRSDRGGDGRRGAGGRAGRGRAEGAG
ncbi:hypothetical protein F8271_15715 [Micromonospora sp. ALFpr18c]|nr:hypothetical protein F8271_15715 [Micromonospora sp. ALFpr18c]